MLNLALIWLSSSDAHTRLQPADIRSNPISCSRVLELTLAIFRAVRRKQNTTAEFHDVEEGGGQRVDAAERKIWVEKSGVKRRDFALFKVCFEVQPVLSVTSPGSVQDCDIKTICFVSS